MTSVELRDHLRSHERFAVACVLIPIIAAGITYLMVRDTATTWRAEQRLALPAPLANSSAGTVAQWIANFSEALQADAVLNAAEQATGLPSNEVSDRLKASQDGRSALVVVAYRGARPEDGPAVLDVVIPAALERVATPQRQALDTAHAAVKALDAQREAAIAAIGTLLADTGVVDPIAELPRAEAALTATQTELAIAESVNSERVPGLRASVEQLQARVDALRSLVVQYEPLQHDLDQANTALADAQRREVDARTELGSLTEPLPVQDVEVTPRPPGPVIRRAVLSAAGLGVLGAGALVLLRLLAGRPGPYAPMSKRQRRRYEAETRGLPRPREEAPTNGDARDPAVDAPRSSPASANGPPGEALPATEVASAQTEVEFERFVKRLREAVDPASPPADPPEHS